MPKILTIKFLIYIHIHGLNGPTIELYNSLITEIINEVRKLRESLRDRELLGIIQKKIGNINEITLPSYMLVVQKLVEQKIIKKDMSTNVLISSLKSNHV
jgi:hypothetical protein